MQTTTHALMVRPACFQANPETFASNAFQRPFAGEGDLQAAAAREFDGYAETLERAGVQVLVVQDDAVPPTPDAVFPNNWVTFHGDGTLLLHPMEAPNRRLERKARVLEAVAERFEIRRTFDLSHLEASGRFLEGTGSMVLDRERRIAYLCRSSRTHPAAMAAFSALMGYEALWFDGVDAHGRPIYHTNVMMALGSVLAIICLEVIPDPCDRKALLARLEETGKTVLTITQDQMSRFAANVVELRAAGGPVFGLSRQAWQALAPHQRTLVEAHGVAAIAPLDTIEGCGGGGARCMVAEIHLPPKQIGNALRAG